MVLDSTLNAREFEGRGLDDHELRGKEVGCVGEPVCAGHGYGRRWEEE